MSTDLSTDTPKEIVMTTESDRQATKPASTTQPAEQQASDFFPPGTGWNHAKKPDSSGKWKAPTNEPVNLDKH